MKKMNLLFAITLVLLATTAVTTFAQPRDFYHIVTTPGGDMATQMNVQWHSDTEGTFLELTLATDPSFAQATRYYPETRRWNALHNSSGFVERTICQVELTDLTPRTKYIYRVGKTSYSDTYAFETGGTGGNFSFLSLTDPQYGSLSGANVFNNLTNKAYEVNPDIRFSVFAGDVVDRGGISNQWEWFFVQNSIRKNPVAVTPGNHEYYDASSSPIHTDADYFNAHYFNPQNGAPTSLNSSYYFKYNNALFVSLDVENFSEIEAQRAWFAHVMESVHAQFIIVFMHRSLYGSQYASVSPGLRAQWQGLFDKYGVDLVLSGHDHVYARSHNIYQHQVEADLSRGTTYIIGGSAGQKFYSPSGVHAEYYAHTVSNTSMVSIMTVTSQAIEIRAIDIHGNILDNHSIPAKRSSLVRPATEDAIMNEFTFTPNTIEKNKATLVWSNNYYGHVSNVVIKRGTQTLVDHYLYTNNMNTLELTNLFTDRRNDLTVEVKFRSGVIRTLNYVVDNSPSFGTVTNLRVEDASIDSMRLVWDAALENNVLQYYELLINGELIDIVSKENTSYLIEELWPFTVHEITLRGMNVYHETLVEHTISYGEEVLELEIEIDPEKTVIVGDVFTWWPIITPAIDVVWEIQIDDESIVSFVDGSFVAQGAGTTSITFHEEWFDTSITVMVTVELPYIPVESVSIVGVTTLRVEDSIALSASVTPSNATTPTVTWSSSNTEVASVTQDGVVTAHKQGSVIITASTLDASTTHTLVVEPKIIVVTSIALDGPTSIVLGETATLTIVITPEDATNKTIVWEYDSSIVTITSQGAIIGVGIGTTTIKAVIGEVEASIQMEVTAPTIPATAVSIHGKNTLTVGEKTTLTVTILPTNATSKVVNWVSSDPSIATISESGEVTALKVGTITISAIHEDMTTEHTITIEALPTRGCGARNASIVLLTLAGGFFFLRKRKII